MGGENLIRNSLEFVVFEKFISDEYGRWRIHDKIIPEWAHSQVQVHRTYRRPKVTQDDLELKERHEKRRRDMTGEKSEERSEENIETEENKNSSAGQSPQPALT